MQVTKKVLVINLLVLVLLLAISGLVGAEDTKQKSKLAVLKFEGGAAKRYRESAANILSKTLYDFGRFEVINRSEIGQILEEQKFQNSGLVDQSQAAEIGNVLAADIAVIGSVNSISSEHKTSEIGDYYDAQASVTVKFINVETAQTVHIIENSISASADERESAKQEALEDCFGHNFLVELRKKFAISSNIIKTNGTTVYFLNGKDLGVKQGARYKVLHQEKVSKELGFGEDNQFREKVGVVKVVKVTKNLAKAKILWKKGEIKQGDLVKEMVSNSNNQFKFELNQRNVNLTRKDQTDKTSSSFIYRLHYGWETPFQGETSFYGGMSFMDEINMYDLGLQLGREFAISSGKTYLSVKGNGGLAMARQDFGNNYDTGSAKSFYLGGSAGLKYYTNYEEGIRLDAGVNWQLGPKFSDWSYEDSWFWYDYDTSVDQYTLYKEVDFSGVGFYGTITIPFGHGAGKEKAMELGDIKEKTKKASNILETIRKIVGY